MFSIVPDCTPSKPRARFLYNNGRFPQPCITIYTNRSRPTLQVVRHVFCTLLHTKNRLVETTNKLVDMCLTKLLVKITHPSLAKFRTNHKITNLFNQYREGGRERWVEGGREGGEGWREGEKGREVFSPPPIPPASLAPSLPPYIG